MNCCVVRDYWKMWSLYWDIFKIECKRSTWRSFENCLAFRLTVTRVEILMLKNKIWYIHRLRIHKWCYCFKVNSYETWLLGFAFMTQIFNTDKNVCAHLSKKKVLQRSEMTDTNRTSYNKMKLARNNNNTTAVFLKAWPPEVESITITRDQNCISRKCGYKIF